MPYSYSVPMTWARRAVAWSKSGLFWRTFFLLGTLTTLSMVAWVGMVSVVQREPQAQANANLVISVITITRAALKHMGGAPDQVPELMFDLVSNEGIRIIPREDDDKVKPAASTWLMDDTKRIVKDKLGTQTRFASDVNGTAGFWVSFDIDGDEYWVMMNRERVRGGLTFYQWLGWASVVSVLSLLGSAAISSLINRPLARLAAASRAMAQGRQPASLPERGPVEIREANRSFNQMVADLRQVDSDRAVILAGISHDLRTPLARMQLEIEMAHLPDDARIGMQSDIGQMDAIIGQFLDYAKPTEAASFRAIDVSALLADIGREAMRLPDVKVRLDIAPGAHVMGNDTDLTRVINNLIENARRYGKTQDSGITEIDIRCQAAGKKVLIEVQDHGQGVPDDQINTLMKPFTRMDTARGQANGAGLGLAIVERVMLRHGAELRVRNRDGGGLLIQISMAAA